MPISSMFNQEYNCCLMGTPQITFFKSVFRKHANFYIESKKLNFSSKPGFGIDPEILKDDLYAEGLYVSGRNE